MNLKEDAKKEFELIITKYILPLVPTTGELQFRDKPVPKLEKLIKLYKTKDGRKRLYFYPCLENPQFHFRVFVDYNTPALGPAESILREIMYVSEYKYNDPSFSKLPYFERIIPVKTGESKSKKKIDCDYHVYRTNRFDIAYELGLCNWLGGTSVFRLLDKLQNWSRKTYEGQRMSFSFIIDAENRAQGSSDYIRFLDSNHSAVFTDGMTSGIALDNIGQIVKYFSAREESLYDEKHLPLVPYRFRDFAQKCYTDDAGVWVGIVLQTNGDVLIFKNRQLIFVKRNGAWFYIDAYRICSIIEDYLSVDADSKKQIAKELFISILDVSFSRAGGCMALIDEKHKQIVKDKFIYRDDIDRIDHSDEKKEILRRLLCCGMPDKEALFHTLDRKLRQELLSLDGATVIDSSGRILCSGAIVALSGGSDGGGRTAAAKQLACYGLGIKVSMDGYVEGFRLSDIYQSSTGTASANTSQSPVETVFTLLK